MDAITYTALRSNLAKTMDQVCDDHAPVTITRSNARPVVMLSLEDYQALAETAYLRRCDTTTDSAEVSRLHRGKLKE